MLIDWNLRHSHICPKFNPINQNIHIFHYLTACLHLVPAFFTSSFMPKMQMLKKKKRKCWNNLQYSITMQQDKDTQNEWKFLMQLITWNYLAAKIPRGPHVTFWIIGSTFCPTSSSHLSVNKEVIPQIICTGFVMVHDDCISLTHVLALLYNDNKAELEV